MDPRAQRLVSSLRFPAVDRSLHLVRAEFQVCLTRIPLAEEAAHRVLLAASEAVSNAIEHGSLPGRPVHVDLTAEPTATVVTVRDQGRPGASTPAVLPSEPPPPSVHRGRGLVIMARLADDLRLRPVGAGTEVRLLFARGAEAARGRSAA